MLRLRFDIILLVFCLVPALSARAQTAPDARESIPFRILVRDAETKRGVPLVELTTTSNVTYITDNAGMIAFDEPGLMNTRVHFKVKSHGYEYPADGFDIRGKALDITPGGSATIDINRVNIAERLYRTTGVGLYHHSARLGDDAPIDHPLVNGLVTGQDSIQSIVYDGKIFWFWGDTSRLAYPLGNFHMSGATSPLPPPDGDGLDPARGINLDYFVDDNGFSRPMIPMDKPGPVWADGFMTLPDESGEGERLVCHWARIKSLGEIYERGLAVYNDSKRIFEPVRTMPAETRIHPYGHPVELQRGEERFYAFGSPFPCMLVPPRLEAVNDPTTYRAYTPYVRGADGPEARTIERDANDRIAYDWKNATKPLEMREMMEWRRAGAISRSEQWFDLRDIETGDSVAWNSYRKKWIAIVLQSFGEPSTLGEIWYAEADTSLGPWVWARRIVTHDQYSFYNPKHHPFLDQDGGRVIFFEGTYTKMFSNTEHATPRYDYNQIMYRLSLDDARLHLPAPVYAMRDGRLIMRDGVHGGAESAAIEDVPFFAIATDDQTDAMIPVYGEERDGVFRLTRSQPNRATQPLFYAHATVDGNEPAMNTLVPLHEFTHDDGRRRYSTQKSLGEEWDRAADPLCYVWESRIAPHVIAPLVREGFGLRPTRGRRVDR